MRKKAKIIGLGGTIASGAQRESGGVVPSLTAADLIGAVPGLTGLADIAAQNFANVPSTEIGLPLLLRLADEIRGLERDGFAGVVITQGTDTIEETAHVLDMLLDCAFPVIVTGAMRNPTLPGADGPANLLAAVACAISPACRDQGVLVVSDDTIHAAAWVQKRDSAATGAFWSPAPLGWMAEGEPAIRAKLPRRPALDLPRDPARPWVPIAKPALWDDVRGIRALVEAGAEGLVLDLSGGGHVAASLVDCVAEAAARIPVVFASRTRGGRVLRRTYGQPGAEIDLIARGCVPGGDLDALKARLTLILLLIANAPDRFTEFSQLTIRG